MTDSGPVSGAEPGRARGTEGEQVTEARSAAGGGRWPFWLPVGVLLVGLLVTGVLVWISASTYSSNEKRLLNLRVRDAGALIAEALPSVQTPLASAAALADATDGDVAKFKKFIGPSVAAKRFASVSLWRLGPNQTGPIAVVGTAPELGSSPSRAETFFANGAAHSATRGHRSAGAPAAAPRLRVHLAGPDRPLRRLRRERAAGEWSVEAPEQLLVCRPPLRAVPRQFPAT